MTLVISPLEISEDEEMNSNEYLDAMNQLQKKFEENEHKVKKWEHRIKDLKMSLIGIYGLLKTMEKMVENHEHEESFNYMFETVLYQVEDTIRDFL